ncbi:hypothetical protein CU048_04200 [Beijerinckiaceae bacterium]|nr:hypothetical protein CU048_04200 [Beijerinckiaceae bacterium]
MSMDTEGKGNSIRSMRRFESTIKMVFVGLCTFLVGAYLVSYATEGDMRIEIASYASPEGTGHVGDTASYAAPEGNGHIDVA